MPLEIQTEILIKLLFAFCIGLIIGYERSGKGAAGLRTLMLICVGSTLTSAISLHFVEFHSFVDDRIRIDPMHLMSAIITGIGFLGAGVIIKSGKRVMGMTTAATIWMTAAIGIAIGAEYYLPAFVSTLIILSIEPIARWQYRHGVKVDPYIISIKKIHTKDVMEMLNQMSIKQVNESIKGPTVALTILSSIQKNIRLVETLDEKKIPFSLEQGEE